MVSDGGLILQATTNRRFVKPTVMHPHDCGFRFMARRDFFSRMAIGASALSASSWLGTRLSALEPFRRTGSARLLLSLAAYSFRDQLLGNKLDLFQFIDFCAQHGCVGAELTSYYFPKDSDDAFLARVKRHAFLRGVVISGTAVGNSFTHEKGPKRDEQMQLVKTWVDRAALLGAPHIRVFAGAAPKEMAPEIARKNCIEALEEAGEYAGKKGVWLGVENHGGIVAEARQLVGIIQAVQSKWVGVNLDTGNFHTEDPYADLATVAPYAVNVQFKGEIKPRNGVLAKTDIPRVAKILKEANYQGFVALEYESKPDPFEAVPALLAEMKAAFA